MGLAYSKKEMESSTQNDKDMVKSKSDLYEIDNIEYLNEYMGTYVEQFLTKNKMNSEDTRKNYLSDINRLITDILGYKEFDYGDFKYLTRRDFESITIDKFIEYRQSKFEELDEYGERKYKNGTINRWFSCYKSLYEYLEARDKIKYPVSKMQTLLKNLPKDSVEIDTLSTEDAERCLEYFKSQEFGYPVYLAAKISIYTGLRAKEILTMQWNQFYVNQDNVVIKSKGKIKGKGNKDWEKEISLSLYEELLVLKKEKVKRVFPIGYSTIAKHMSKAVIELDLDEKDYSFHSFRKCAATNVYEMTNDLLAVKDFLNHTNANTSQLYVKKKKNPLTTAYSTGDNIDKELYKKVDNETLIKTIESLGDNFKHLLNIKISEYM